VLPSSTELFFAIGRGMDESLRLLGDQGDESGMMRQMCAMYKKWLKVYAGRSSPLRLTQS
jgi:hypothetical protein